MARQAQQQPTRKDVAPAQSSDVALWDDQPTGFENTTQGDFVLPFIKILQKMSPEVDPDSSAYVEGAKVGQFMDTSTGETFDEIEVIPCYFQRADVEWKDRDAGGGGFVAQHPPGYAMQLNLPRAGKGGSYTTPEGNVIFDTSYFFCLRLTEDGDLRPAVISFTSTQTKKGRTWLTKMAAMTRKNAQGQTVRRPMYSGVWRMTTVAEENDQGTWRGYKIEFHEDVTSKAMVEAAIAAHAMFHAQSGNVARGEATATGGEGVKRRVDEPAF